VSAPPLPKIVFLFLGYVLESAGRLQKKEKKRQTARPKFRFEKKNRINPINLVDFFMVAPPTAILLLTKWRESKHSFHRVSSSGHTIGCHLGGCVVLLIVVVDKHKHHYLNFTE